MNVDNAQSDIEKPGGKVFYDFQRFNRGLAKFELYAAAFFLIVIFVLLLINVTTRALSVPVYWVDEAAIMAMVWMTLLAASASIEKRSSIAVTLLSNLLPRREYRYLMVLVDLIILVFFLALIVLCIRWFDPVGLYRSGWDVDKFSMSYFNYIYQEPTLTLGIQKFWIWLVMPLFSCLGFVHSVANIFSSVSAVYKKGK